MFSHLGYKSLSFTIPKGKLVLYLKDGTVVKGILKAYDLHINIALENAKFDKEDKDYEVRESPDTGTLLIVRKGIKGEPDYSTATIRFDLAKIHANATPPIRECSFSMSGLSSKLTPCKLS
ncbi:MAG TPA: hypothetical protein EYP51_08855 [Thiotrichales bacterium]|nr:hypothetical protein [Thiotrichales bacterium]